MKKTTFLFTFFSLLFLSVSCSKKAQQTETTLKLSGVSSGFSALLGYEVMIYGVNKDNGDSFGLKFNGSSLSLSNGRWDFLVSSWDDGAMSLTSTYRCGKASANLIGGDQSIAINLSANTCQDTAFGPEGTKDIDGPLQTTFYTFATNECFEEADGQNCYRGISRSYRVTLPEFEGTSTKQTGVVSACVDHANDEKSLLSNIKMPIYTPNNTQLKIPVKIETFHELNCTGSSETFLLKEGFLAPKNRIAEINFGNGDFGDEVTVSVRNDLCSKTTVAATGFRFSTNEAVGDRTHVVCNTTEFDNLRTDGFYPTEIILLGSDIDFEGASFIPIPYLTGQFIGLNRRISNFVLSTTHNEYGLFQSIESGGMIRDLVIENPTLIVNGNNIAGVLAGKIVDDSSIENLTINGAIVTINSANTEKVGVVAGLVNPSTPAGVNLKNIKLNNVVFNIDANPVVEFGAGFGRLMNSGGSVFVENMKVSGFRIDTQAVTDNISYMGAVAGAATGAVIRDVMVTGLSFVTNSAYTFSARDGVGGVLGISYGGVVMADVSVEGEMIFDPLVCPSTCLGDFGGLVGVVSGAGAIDTYENIITDVNISAANLDSTFAIGGVIGRIFGGNEGANLSFLRSFGDVSGTTNVGGLIGSVENVTTAFDLKNSYSKGNVTASSLNAGGIVGKLDIGNARFVQSVFSTGDIYAENNSGGLIGDRLSGMVYDAYVTGAISADNLVGNAGGLIGMSAQPLASGLLNSLLAMSNVSGLNTGAINFITTPAPGNEADCYYDSEVTNITDTDCIDIETVIDPLVDGPSLDTGTWSTGTWVSSLAPKLRFSVGIEALSEKILGTFNQPILINTPMQWNMVGDNPFFMSRVLRLESNLDFSGLTFIPWASNANPFQGVLQGNNRTISNIDHTSSLPDLGLITRIAGNAQASFIMGVYHRDPLSPTGYRSLTLLNNKFHQDGNETLGALVGFVADNDLNSVALKIAGVNVVGGELSTNEGALIGGLIGSASISSDESSIFANTVSVNIVDCDPSFTTAVGGIVGYLEFNAFDKMNFSSLKSNAVMDGVCQPAKAGGLIGELYNATASTTFEIQKSIFEGVVHSDIMAGGIVGGAVGHSLYIGTSYSNGEVYSNGLASGIIGNSSLSMLDINGVYTRSILNPGNIASSGHFVGTASDAFTIENSYALVPSSTIYSLSAVAQSFANCTNVYQVASIAEGTEACLSGNYEIIALERLIDPALVSLSQGDPWFFDGVTRPKIFFEIFPQFFYMD